MAEDEQISPEEKLLKVIQQPAAQVVETPAAGLPTAAEKESVGAKQPAKAAVAAKPKDSSAVAGKAKEEATKGVVAAKPKLEVKKAGDGGERDVSSKQSAVSPSSNLRMDGEQGSKDLAEGDGGQGIGIAEAKLGRGVEVPGAGSSKIGGGNVILEDKKKVVAKLGVRTINKYLLAAAIIVLCFVAWEAVSYQRSCPDPSEFVFSSNSASPGEDIAVDIDGSGKGLVDIEKVLSAFRKTPIVSFPEVIQQKTMTTVMVEVGPQTDWAKYAKANFKMKGRSKLPGEAGFMAVVADGGSGKLHFLKAGDSVLIEKQQVDVKEVGAKYIKFSDGSVESTVE